MQHITDQKNLIPSQIVEFLDRYIVGQKEAKRSVAIALRNRWRRMQVGEDLKDEISPKNIIMMGPTGVGKTEIARRIAKLVHAPFLKVEASKFTEVGYVGRDVESMIRDLVDISVQMSRQIKTIEVKPKAHEAAIQRVLDILVPPTRIKADAEQAIRDDAKLRESFEKKLRAGDLDERRIEIKIGQKSAGPHIEFLPMGGNEGMDLGEMMKSFIPRQAKPRQVTVKEALRLLTEEEADRLVQVDDLKAEAVKRVEETGIIFLDEIDKIASKEGRNTSGEVSREGVQRDLLPIVEGSTVNSKYGPIQTDHILFIAAGAFHFAKPSDLIPELQGRFPIRVELQSLNKSDLTRILTEPKNSLIRQYTALLATEGVDIAFSDDAIDEIAEMASQVNEKTENIGARRLYAILEKLLDEVSFSAPELTGQKVPINRAYVQERLKGIVQDQDLSRYIL